MNFIAGSRDAHMQVIDMREDRLVTRAREWATDLVNNLQKYVMHLGLQINAYYMWYVFKERNPEESRQGDGDQLFSGQATRGVRQNPGRRGERE